MPDHFQDDSGREPQKRVFATTQWSLVVAAAKNDSVEGSALALEQLCQLAAHRKTLVRPLLRLVECS